MKNLAFFFAMICIASVSHAQYCQADFSVQQSNGVIYFTNLSAPVDSFTTFYWNFGDGTSSTLFNPSHSYNWYGPFGVCLTMSNGLLGCNSTWCDTIYVDSTNNGNCMAYFSPSVNDHDVLFFNLSTWDSGQASYSWSFGDGETSADAEPAHHYDASGYYYPCLTLTTTTGCSSTYCGFVQIVDSACNITFTVQITGNEVSFLPSNGNFGWGTYHWTFGDNSSSNEIAPTHIYNQPGSYIACLTYIDSFCNSSVCDSIYISNGNYCNADFYTYQSGATVFFNPYYVDNSKTYSWSFGDGSSSNDIYAHHEYTTEGYYGVCLTVSDSSCSASMCDSIYYSTSNGNFFCTANFEVSDIDTASNTIWLTDLSTGGVQYLWDFGDGSSSSEQYPSHTYAQNGTYDVCLTITCDSNLTSEYCAWVGLGDSLQNGNEVRTGFTLNVKAAEISGVPSVSPGQSLSIYPNPAMESITVAMPQEIKSNATLYIKNEMGQLIKQEILTAKTNPHVIDIHSLAPGLYMIQVIAEGKSFSGSLLKQ